MLRPLAWTLSALLHGVLLFLAYEFAGSDAYRAGMGGDRLTVEAGVAIDSFEMTGGDQATVAAVETPPTVLSEARPETFDAAKEVDEPPPDVATTELPDNTDVIASPAGPETEVFGPKKPEEKKVAVQPAPAADPPQETAVKEEHKAGPRQSGGDATVRSAYRGGLRAHLGRHTVRPRVPLTGTVVVRFTVDASGKLLERKVTESSGHKALDDAALASLDRAAPFPPFPAAMRRDPIILEVPFRFVTR